MRLFDKNGEVEQDDCSGCGKIIFLSKERKEYLKEFLKSDRGKNQVAKIKQIWDRKSYLWI